MIRNMIIWLKHYQDLNRPVSNTPVVCLLLIAWIAFLARLLTAEQPLVRTVQGVLMVSFIFASISILIGAINAEAIWQCLSNKKKHQRPDK